MDREFLGSHRSVNSVSVGLGLSLPVHRSQSTTLERGAFTLPTPLHAFTLYTPASLPRGKIKNNIPNGTRGGKIIKNISE